jgi:lipopolysaccharide/colanic/teichoic acid biosynthesis glycosyltransferase
MAAFGLVVLLPLLIGIAIAVKSTSPGPVFFTQNRVGRYGRLFTMIKFRTMVTNDGHNTVTAKNDSRITPTGAFLRKWKLDELPELINVLLGDMSLVGPRPDVPGYADALQGNDRRILELRPGITGPASLKYYNEEEILAGVENPKEYNDRVIFPDKVKINLKYLEKCSLAEDLKIIFYTVLRKDHYEY